MKVIEVVAAIIRQDDQILLTQRSDQEFYGLWEFPGGKIEEGETHEQALKREIMEELNLNIDVEQSFMSLTHQYDHFIVHLYTYFCEIKSGEIQKNVHLDYQWLKRSELLGLNYLPATKKLIENLTEK